MHTFTEMSQISDISVLFTYMSANITHLSDFPHMSTNISHLSGNTNISSHFQTSQFQTSQCTEMSVIFVFFTTSCRDKARTSPHHITLFSIGQTFVISDHGYFLSNPMTVQSPLRLSNFLPDQIMDNPYQTI